MAEDWTKLVTWEAELNRIQEKIKEVTSQIVVSDGSLRLDYRQTYEMLRKREREVKMEIMRRKLKSDGESRLSAQPVRPGFDC